MPKQVNDQRFGVASPNLIDATTVAPASPSVGTSPRGPRPDPQEFVPSMPGPAETIRLADPGIDWSVLPAAAMQLAGAYFSRAKQERSNRNKLLLQDSVIKAEQSFTDLANEPDPEEYKRKFARTMSQYDLEQNLYDLEMDTSSLTAEEFELYNLRRNNRMDLLARGNTGLSSVYKRHQEMQERDAMVGAVMAGVAPQADVNEIFDEVTLPGVNALDSPLDPEVADNLREQLDLPIDDAGMVAWSEVNSNQLAALRRTMIPNGYLNRLPKPVIQDLSGFLSGNVQLPDGKKAIYLQTLKDAEMINISKLSETEGVTDTEAYQLLALKLMAEIWSGTLDQFANHLDQIPQRQVSSFLESMHQSNAGLDSVDGIGDESIEFAMKAIIDQLLGENPDPIDGLTFEDDEDYLADTFRSSPELQGVLLNSLAIFNNAANSMTPEEAITFAVKGAQQFGWTAVRGQNGRLHVVDSYHDQLRALNANGSDPRKIGNKYVHAATQSIPGRDEVSNLEILSEKAIRLGRSSQALNGISDDDLAELVGMLLVEYQVDTKYTDQAGRKVNGLGATELTAVAVGLALQPNIAARYNGMDATSGDPTSVTKWRDALKGGSPEQKLEALKALAPGAMADIYEGLLNGSLQMSTASLSEREIHRLQTTGQLPLSIFHSDPEQSDYFDYPFRTTELYFDLNQDATKIAQLTATMPEGSGRVNPRWTPPELTKLEPGEETQDIMDLIKDDSSGVRSNHMYSEDKYPDFENYLWVTVLPLMRELGVPEKEATTTLSNSEDIRMLIHRYQLRNGTESTYKELGLDIARFMVDRYGN